MLPTDIQMKIYEMVVNMRKPLYISDELMKEVSGHSGMLFNILKKTQLINSSYIHVKYTNLSLLTYYLIIILTDKSNDKTCDGNNRCLFNSDFIGIINFELFLIYNEIQLTKLLLIITKCWDLMCVKQRLRAHKFLTTDLL
jgi:hypothetical protein